ncbi:hypothetical protein AMTRI_Chr08g164280 [Amborella trichopoda]
MPRIKSLTPGRSRIENLRSWTSMLDREDRASGPTSFWGWEMQLAIDFPIERDVLPWVPLPSQESA